jgi:hypothetical protein
MKYKSLYRDKKILWIAILFSVLLFIYYTFLTDDIVSNRKDYDLEMDGLTILPNLFRKDEIQYLRELSKLQKYKEMKVVLLNHGKLKSECLKITTSDYVFQDYIWIIQKSTIHTCHRDNNGDFFNVGQKHPSYTILVYLEPMEKCIGVIPTSHLKRDAFNYNVSDQVVNLACNPGDVIIFNANLIHVGAMNQNRDHLRCQIKFSHKDDIPLLKYYENYNKVLNESNPLPNVLKHIQKRFSCAFPVLSNLTQVENVRTTRGSDNGVEVGIAQKIFSYLFYGNKDYYDLPNAF